MQSEISAEQTQKIPKKKKSGRHLKTPQGHADQTAVDQSPSTEETGTNVWSRGPNHGVHTLRGRGLRCLSAGLGNSKVLDNFLKSL